MPNNKSKLPSRTIVLFSLTVCAAILLMIAVFHDIVLTDESNRITVQVNHNDNNRKTDDTSAQTHFLIVDNVGEDLCREFHSGEVPSWSGQSVKEGDRISIPVKIKENQQKDFQICLAKHKHQHIFKIHLTTTTELQGDCDMYLSASIPKPDINSWEWKSNGLGEDAISIYGYASEFQKSSLNSLFISVYGKTNINSCSLQIEILSLPSEEILKKLGLRGSGQVLLPRDVKDMKAFGKSHQNSNIKNKNNIHK